MANIFTNANVTKLIQIAGINICTGDLSTLGIISSAKRKSSDLITHYYYNG